MPKHNYKWDYGHDYGWIFYKKNKQIARLEYEGFSGFWRRFKVIPFTEDKNELKHLNTIMDICRDDVYYQNIKLDMKVFDADFICGYVPEDCKVNIRDFRLPPLIPTIFDKIFGYTPKFKIPEKLIFECNNKKMLIKHIKTYSHPWELFEVQKNSLDAEASIPEINYKNSYTIILDSNRIIIHNYYWKDIFYKKD